MKAPTRRHSRFKGFERFDIPLSPRACPICGGEMGFKINSFFCHYHAVNGPYMHGSVLMVCMEDACRYRTSVRFDTSDPRLFGRIWRCVLVLEGILLAASENFTEVKTRAQRQMGVYRNRRDPRR